MYLKMVSIEEKLDILIKDKKISKELSPTEEVKEILYKDEEDKSYMENNEPEMVQSVFSKEKEDKVNSKIRGTFGHAIPEEKRSNKIEEVLVYAPIDREKVKINEADITLDPEEFKKWKKFNNKHERGLRETSVYFTDDPTLSDEAIVQRHRTNEAKLKENFMKQVKLYPELLT